MTQPLTDAITALTRYANEVTGASDTTLSDAVRTLCDGYGGGGGITPEDVLRDLQPSGDVEITLDPAIDLPQVFGLNGTPIQTLIIHGLRTISGSNGPFRSMTALKKLVLPDLEGTFQGEHFAGSFVSDGSGVCILPKFYRGQFNNFGTNSYVGLIDFGSNCTRFMSLYRCMHLTKLILRSNSVVTLKNANNFGATPFASGGAGGEIYIPKVLYDHLGDGSALDYKSATNWSTVDGYGTITWMQIEGSPYENTDWWKIE